MLHAGEALFVATGQTESLKAASDPSTMLHFLLTPDPERPVVAVPISVKELFRSMAPIPDLKPGTYDLNLTRITFPPHMPSNPPHHRSGAALYYVLSGTGANTIAGKTEAKGPGSFIWRPWFRVSQRRANRVRLGPVLFRFARDVGEASWQYPQRLSLSGDYRRYFSARLCRGFSMLPSASPS
jgi:quercetin dioxygenase-like cupin family protein